MRRLRTAACLGLALASAGCASSRPLAGVTPSPPCTRLSLPSGAGGPPALVHDVAAYQGEFLLGWPGDSRLQLAPSLSSYGLPAVFGHALLLTRYIGVKPEIWILRQGACAVHFADGSLESADPSGNGIVVTTAAIHQLVDARGRVIAKLNPGIFSWTYGGLLGDGDARGTLTVYDKAGRDIRHMSIPGAYPVGSLGPTAILLRSGSNLLTVDLQSGAQRSLGPTQAFIASGSPDGRYVAVADVTSQPHLIRVSDGTTQVLPQSSPVTHFDWSPDSHWLGVACVYGGDLFSVPDARVQNLGSLVVVGWLG